MKTYIAYGAFVLALATALMGCDPKSGETANVVTPATCIAPNYLNSNGVCVTPSGVVVDPGTGPVSYTDAFNDYSLVNGGYRAGNLRITDSSAFKNFLKTAMGVCDRYSSKNSGYYSCDSWLNGRLKVDVRVDSTTANQAYLQFTATQGTSGDYFNGFLGVLLPIPYQNPLMLSGSALSIINNYAGFDISRQVNLNTVQLIVRNGKLGDATINYELAYGSQTINPARVFATGTLTRSY